MMAAEETSAANLEHVNFSQIFESFQNFTREARWIVWRLDNGRKVPLSKNNVNAVGNLISHAAPLKEVMARTTAGPNLNPGFVLSGDLYPIVGGVDLDGCRNPQTGEIDEWAKTWVNKLNTYTEISPSGTGVKIFVNDVTPVLGNHVAQTGRVVKFGKKPQIEIYTTGRYFAVTGWRLEAAPNEIRKSPEAWKDILDYIAS